MRTWRFMSSRNRKIIAGREQRQERPGDKIALSVCARSAQDLTQPPERYRYCQPSGRSGEEYRRRGMSRKKNPDDGGESQEPNGAERRAAGLERGGIAATGRAIDASTVLLGPLVRGYQRSRGGENRGKRKKYPADGRAEPLRDDSGDDGNQAAEKKTDGVLVRLGFGQRRQIEFDVHQAAILKKKNHNVSATASHKKSSNDVEILADGLKQYSRTMAHQA